MKRLKAARLGIAAAGCAFAALSAQAVTITVDKVQQRWPWNNKVDITYTIAGDDTDTVLDSNNAKVVFTTVVNGNTYTFETGPNENVWNGTHTITWEGAPSGVKSDSCKMSAAYYTEAVPTGDDYMIVELRTGNVSYEGLGSDEGRIFGSCTAQEIANSRYNNIMHYDSTINVNDRTSSRSDGKWYMPKFKTSHMVLRKIPAGTYTAQGKSWTVASDFYVQVFLYTNYQYWDVFGLCGQARNWHQQNEYARGGGIGLHWTDIRGGTDVETRTSGTSDPKNVVRWLNGRIQANSSLPGYFDLPTLEMLEVATRAGTTTTYFWGSNSASDAKNYVVFNGDGTITGDPRTERSNGNWRIPGNSTIWKIGTRLPNNWGFYDMVGMEWKWCLDVQGGSRASGSEDNIFAPRLGTNGNRILFGGDWNTTSDFGSSKNSGDDPGKIIYIFRLAYYPPVSAQTAE